jgi:hypothetical protein
MRPLATIGAATILAGIAWIAYGMMSGDSGPEEACRTASPFYIGGIQVNEPDHRHWVDTLDEIGMNTVAVTVYATHGAWDDAELWFADAEPSVLDEIRAARARGLSVVLVLRVALDHGRPRNKFLWHGMIMPGSDAAIDAWFERYTEFVVRWAEIGQREGVEILGIGSELKALTATLPITRWGNFKNYYGYYWYQRLARSRALDFAAEIERRHLWVRGYENYDDLETYLDDRFRHTTAWAQQAYLRDLDHMLEQINRRRERINRHWIRLIGRVREDYAGKLTYAANFDHYQNVGFWSQLDLIGINSYFSLREGVDRELKSSEKLALFIDRWREIFADLDRFQASQGVSHLPLLFTEIGYTFRQHATVEPWAHDGFSIVGWKDRPHRLVVWSEQPVDYEERELALKALRTVHVERGSNLAGLLYWKLSTNEDHERIEPFVVHIGTDSTDPLQHVLVDFASSAKAGSNHAAPGINRSVPVAPLER